MQSKRTITMRFRVNEVEEKEIKSRVERANMDVSSYMRQRCLSEEVVPNNKQNAEIVKYLCEFNSYLCYMAHQTTQHTDTMKEFYKRGIELCGSIQANY